MKRVTKLAALLIVGLGTCSLLAQSLADVAREQREAERPRSNKVYTNDDIPPVNTLRSAPADAKVAEGQKTETAKSGEQAKAEDTTKTAETKKAGDSSKAEDKNADASKPTANQTAEEFLAEREKRDAEWNTKISEEQAKVAALQGEVDTLSRERQQKQREQAAAAWLNYGSGSSPAEEKAYQQLLESKQQALEAERAKLQTVQQEASQAGVKIAE